MARSTVVPLRRPAESGRRHPLHHFGSSFASSPDRLGATSQVSCFLLALLICLSGPNVTNYDSYLAVPTAWSMLHEGNLNLDEYDAPLVRAHHGYRTVGAHQYDFYPWPVALLALPVVGAVALGEVIGLGPGPDRLIATNNMDGLQLVAASLVVAATAMVMAMVAYERGHGRGRRRSGGLGHRDGSAPAPPTSSLQAVAVGVTLVTASALWSTASRALWQHGPAALFLALGLLYGQRLIAGGPGQPGTTTRHHLALGASLSLAVVMRPTALIGAMALAVAVTFAGVRAARRSVSPIPVRALGASVAGAALVFVPFSLVNLATFSTLLPASYSSNRLALHPAYAQALAANLISPARGLLIFSPVLVVAGVDIALRQRRGERPSLLSAACLVAVGAHWLVVSAGSFGWWAGHSYGARFFTELTPLLAYPALGLVERFCGASRRWRGAVAVALVASVAMQVPGVYLRVTNCWNTDPMDIDIDPSRIWSWSNPPFLHALRAGADGLAWRQVVLGPCPELAGRPVAAAVTLGSLRPGGHPSSERRSPPDRRRR